MKIYTRTGDSGDTALFDGTRVPKSDSRVAAYGELDELDAWIGFVVANLAPSDISTELQQIQRDLFAIGSASPIRASHRRSCHRSCSPAMTSDGSKTGSTRWTRLEPLRRFILAGGTLGRGRCTSRGRCRRAASDGGGGGGLEPELLCISTISRSALARAVNQRGGVAELPW